MIKQLDIELIPFQYLCHKTFMAPSNIMHTLTWKSDTLDSWKQYAFVIFVWHWQEIFTFCRQLSWNTPLNSSPRLMRSFFVWFQRKNPRSLWSIALLFILFSFLLVFACHFFLVNNYVSLPSDIACKTVISKVVYNAVHYWINMGATIIEKEFFLELNR